MSSRHAGAGFWPRIEKLLLAFGVTMLAFYSASCLYTMVASHIALTRFKTGLLASPVAATPGKEQFGTRKERLDFGLWSEKRIHAYQLTLAMNFDPAVAVL